MKKPDFAGWATKYNVKCSDGCTILPSTFQHNDGSVVPLVWQHKGTELDNVLGNVTLKHTDEGVYAYASFNKTHMGQMAKSAVDNGDLKHLSIGAKNIQRKPGNLVHSGDIYEVSLVLTGANSQALIETVLTHSDGSGEEIIITNPDYIHHGDQIQYEYMTSDDLEDEELQQSDDLDANLEHADETRTVGDVVESMNEEQRSILEYLLGRAITTTKGEDDMKHNVFTNGTSQEDILQHAERVSAYKSALQHAYDTGTGRLSDVLGSVMEHAENKGVSNIEVLFPEYKTLTAEPVIYDHNNLASEAIFNGTSKAPFNRIRTWSVDITEQEARARGYIKANEKFEQIYGVLKRETTPQTVYVKQKFDRDDIIDITDFNLVNWAKKIMAIKLKEELARAILVGDGRLVTDPDKIFPDKIRPIISDNDLYTMKASYTDLHSLFETVLVAMEEYRGSGAPTLIITPTLLTQLKLMRDNENRFLFGLGASNATIAAMFNCSGVIETDFLPTGSMLIVNLSDYTCGATAGGKITDFDQFDIDFNVEKFLRETRMCGALTRLKSALYVTPATPGAVRTNGLVPKGEYAGVVNKEAAPVQNGNKPEVTA